MTTYIYTMGQRFKAVAREFPNRPALAFPNTAPISYAALDALSDLAAAHMRKAGARAGEVVAIFADKQLMTYVAMLAALKLGTPYVILDTHSPMERLGKILECCQPKLLVCDAEIWHRNGMAVLTLEQLASPCEKLPLCATELVHGATPAYIMFTSGSTGFPKGVTITHAAMLNLCNWAKDTFAITPYDVLSGANALYFDNSVFDFAASLFNGASLVPVDRETAQQPKALAQAMHGCSIWFSVPSLLIYLLTLRALTHDSWPFMRAIIFGGEGFAKAELHKLYAMYGQQATLWNVYGPTECTCICSSYAIGPRDFTDMHTLVPLGHLAPNFSGRIMDESSAREVEDGHTGELFLLGPQVSPGYYNDPQRTAFAFAPDPLSPKNIAPCYRTGDLVMRDANTGYYHFVGRKDNQIKHMGYRIELEEIEAALAAFPDMVQPTVIYHPGSPAGRIVAFYQAKQVLDSQQLKEGLRELLPSYMIPQEFHALQQLPKNANGKIDRKTLAAEYAHHHA